MRSSTAGPCQYCERFRPRYASTIAIRGTDLNKAMLEFTQESSQPDEPPDKALTFGARLRYARRQATDPLRGGLLTQDRLGELIGAELGDAGYTGAAISEWERDKSRIHASDREVLLALTAVLCRSGGLQKQQEADELLASGNYRRLDGQERERIFGDCSVNQFAVIERSEAAPLSLSKTRRNQMILLDKVTGFWVQGVLLESLRDAPHLDLPRCYHVEGIDHPWLDHVGESLAAGRLAASDSLREAYENADRGLLILGQPGGGKTTCLLTLADALAKLARADVMAAVPVVLDLSSWVRQRLPLNEWVVEELTAKYQIPRRYGRKWVTVNDLALLLDGLDTLPLQARRECIAAINIFRESHGLAGLVVCSRTEEYEAAQRPLRLNGVVSLQPLGEAQIDSFLSEGGRDLEALGQALQDIPDLADMAHNPLMLNVMAATLAGVHGARATAVEPLPQSPDRQDRLFHAYVQRMFERRPAHPKYTQERTIEHLRWLAARLNEHNQSLFLIEQLQPSWLPGRKSRLLYMLLSGLVTGFAGGIVMWLLWRVLRLTLPQLPAPVSVWLGSFLRTGAIGAEFLTIVLGNLVLGLLLGLILFVFFERQQGIPSDPKGIRRLRRQQTLLVGGMACLFTLAFVLLFAEPLLALAWSVAEGFMYGSVARYLFGWSFQTEVRPVEKLGWSWQHATVGAALGLALAIVAEAIESGLYGYNGASRTIATLLLGGFILGGLRGRITTSKSVPNQGVWLSLRNALFAAVALALPILVLTWFIRDPLYALYAATLAAVIAASLMGAGVFLKHFLLRSMLCLQGQIPWRYARFLDYGANLVILRKVGGGYIFMHGLLQEHFAVVHSEIMDK